MRRRVERLFDSIKVISVRGFRRPRWRALAGQAGLVGAFLVSGGCVATSPMQWIENGFKVGPNYSPPAAPVAEEWIPPSDPKVQSRHQLRGDWWSMFGDATLTALIDRA